MNASDDTTASTGPDAPAGAGTGADDVLERFSPATRAWFGEAFDAPTPVQDGAWRAVSSGDDTLVVAPTGSGKTLAAFLWAIDRLATTEPEGPRCRVLYVSPLKALAVDVERNLASPLVGVRRTAARLGLPEPEITVATRSGDTPARERAAFARRPSDILITTPESLFLLLTSKAREALAGVETVILDEVHAVAGTKRGAHLAVSLARLDALLPARAQRIGLSATVRPVEEVARFLGGGRPATVVAPPGDKRWKLEVAVPVPDLAELGGPSDDLTGDAAGPVARTSVWPHVEEKVVDLVAAHRSTIVFANSRRLAERLTSRLNEIWEERLEAAGGSDEGNADGTDDGTDDGTGAGTGSGAGEPTHRPAQLMGAAGLSRAAPAVLARAHHGSVSKEARAEIEEQLKSGALPAVVATSSLELGIDMGAVDLVVQIESPPSVASGLQRVGRAGHQVGAESAGVILPKYRGDLVDAAVVVERMRSGAIEALRILATPLDVLAQHVVAMCALDAWTVEDLLALLRRTASFTSLSRPVLESVLDMLAGRYPSEEFAELRPRIVWDRTTDTLTGRPGAQRLAVTSGGTIPDRGLYGVFLAGAEGEGGRRVGELDEEMVYESRVGDVFTLGTSTWRIEDITHDRVLVSPAPGVPGRLPFWKGDSPGRPAELGRALGAFVREVAGAPTETARERLADAGLDEWATDNLLAHLGEQREATGHLPDDRTILVERFRDEIGDWRVVVHSPHGAQVHAPWALCIAARMRERHGLDVQALHGDDGIVLRLPDIEIGGADGAPGGRDDPDGPPGGGDAAAGLTDADVVEAIVVAAEDVRELVTTEVGGSALFAARFRECAARSLLLPRRTPGRRQALWQQRQRSAHLLQVASRYPSFPVVLETVRECLQDVFDVDGLVDLLRRVASREVRVVEVATPQASPFARTLMFGYVAEFLYEGDAPLAERRAAALSLDPELLADLLGDEASSLRDLLDPEALARTEARLQRTDPEVACRTAEDAADLVRRIGPLSTAEVADRTVADEAERAASWLAELESARRLIRVRVAGHERWAAVEDAGRLRDALGVALPVGIAEAHLAAPPDPLGDLVARYARTHGPFGAADVAQRLGLGTAVVTDVLRRLVAAGRVVEGELRPPPTDGPAPSGRDFCDAEVLRTLRRRSLAALRAEVEPVERRDLARFVPAWQGVDRRDRLPRGPDATLTAVERLAGVVLPLGALETLVLPARVRDYAPHHLDELLASGDVLWQGHGQLPGGDAWVSLHPADVAPLTLAPPAEDDAPDEAAEALLRHLGGGGSHFFRELVAATGLPESEAARALLDLVWAGRVTGDGFAPLRSRLATGRRGPARPRSARPRRPGRSLGSLGGPGGFAGARREPAGPSGPPGTGGRWSLLPPPETDPTVRGYAQAELLLDRYGVVTRGAVAAAGVPGGFASVYRVFAAAEERGRVRRGYFVEGLGASQFASNGAVDRLRALSRPLDRPASASGRPAGTDGPEALVLAATDPANAYGAALDWPPTRTPDGDGAGDGAGHRPGRRAGALVVLIDGDLVAYVERGGRTVLTFSREPEALAATAGALAGLVGGGTGPRSLTIERLDGAPALGSEHPLLESLLAAGFHTSPKGPRIRR